MRSPRLILVVLTLVFALGNLWSTFDRSGIPSELRGRVERIEVRREKHPGLDDVHLVTIAERTIHLDPRLAEFLEEGDQVHKRAWATAVTTTRDGSLSLEPSRDFWRMLLAMPLIVALALAVTGVGRATGTDSRQGAAPSGPPRDSPS